MGTRADFYVGRGENAEWLGSIAWDGHPDGIPIDLLVADTEEQWRSRVELFLKDRDDATLPEQGWPWPWRDSCTTDYSYAFDETVWATCFGHGWHKASEWDEEEHGDSSDPEVKFPDMKSIQKVDFGKRSGLIIVKGP